MTAGPGAVPSPQEMLLKALPAESWAESEIPGLQTRELWQRPDGISIAILKFRKGAGIPKSHRHASNQFMYCIEGKYEYSSAGITLAPGDFYWNPKGNFHGPTRAVDDCILLEIYDGPHYFTDDGSTPI